MPDPSPDSELDSLVLFLDLVLRSLWPLVPDCWKCSSLLLLELRAAINLSFMVAGVLVAAVWTVTLWTDSLSSSWNNRFLWLPDGCTWAALLVLGADEAEADGGLFFTSSGFDEPEVWVGDKDVVDTPEAGRFCGEPCKLMLFCFERPTTCYQKGVTNYLKIGRIGKGTP